jgi:hypothetical protein
MLMKLRNCALSVTIRAQNREAFGDVKKEECAVEAWRPVDTTTNRNRISVSRNIRLRAT